MVNNEYFHIAEGSPVVMLLHKMMDHFLLYYLGHFDKHCFNVQIHGEEYTIGEGKPEFTLIIHKDIPKKALLESTELALGEAYMRGDIEVKGDLFHMLCTLLEQADRFSLDRNSLRNILYMSEKKQDQAKEVSSHYDLGNDFYKLWLDPTMSYSCAYFKSDKDTLEQAQRNKVDYILQKLYLKPGMTLLDIGCGWGFLLLEAAKKYGVKGYGCTLSKEQWKKSQERIQALGLEGQVTIELTDYRDLEAKDLQFDRVVSVGMMEHVGRSNYSTYMETVNHLLKQGGIFLLHTITGHDEVVSDPWIRKYIFPGGTLPSLRELIHHAYDADFRVLDVESLRRHYCRTLLCWYKNFCKVHEQVARWKDPSFVRMWDLYLCGCAAAFQIGYIDIHQVLMTKGNNNSLPMTRWY